MILMKKTYDPFGRSPLDPSLQGKTIITAALAGNQTSKAQNPNVPHTPEEYVAEAIRCREAGASILHIHVRDPETGHSTHDLDKIRTTYMAIKAAVPDVIMNLTTSVSVQATTRERIAPLKEFKPDMCSLNVNSMNFASASYSKYRVLTDMVFENSFHSIKQITRAVRKNQIKPEIEIFEDGGLNNVLFLAHTDQLSRPLHFQFVFGVLGGVPFTLHNLVHFLTQIPPDSTWSVCGVGRNQIPVALAALSSGGHIRVGLEDGIRNYKGDLAEGSFEQVQWARKIIELAGNEVATPQETRQILNIPDRNV